MAMQMTLCPHCSPFAEGQQIPGDGNCHNDQGRYSCNDCLRADKTTKYYQFFASGPVEGQTKSCRVCGGMRYVLLDPDTGQFKRLQQVNS